MKREKKRGKKRGPLHPPKKEGKKSRIDLIRGDLIKRGRIRKKKKDPAPATISPAAERKGKKRKRKKEPASGSRAMEKRWGGKKKKRGDPLPTARKKIRREKKKKPFIMPPSTE